ncbi:glucokinase [Microvirga massiliensis]|uniref:glucokinase n=1 Tax=Microvirga massiliensis TaxID=1033741 RepID=UPI00062BC50E|nr:glucokinase [Microvirga massiliensis]
MIEFPALLGDIGGTFARFAVLLEPGAPVQLLAKGLTTAHADPTSAILAALQHHSGARPVSALLALAGRISGPVVHLTNAAWTLDAGQIGRDLGLEHVILLNDYVGTAAGLTVLDPATDLMRIGPAPACAGPQVVLGPGTGLGAAALVPYGLQCVLHATEAGHMDFGARHEGEMKLWPLVEHPGGRVSAETLLCGSGLVRLYRALARSRSLHPKLASPADVVTAGRDGGNELAADTLDLFAGLLGRFAGDLALVFGAAGGVFITGGIAQRIGGLLDAGAFRTEFERKFPFETVMERTPTILITHAEPALEGLAAVATHPHRFIRQEARWSRSST